MVHAMSFPLPDIESQQWSFPLPDVESQGNEFPALNETADIEQYNVLLRKCWHRRSLDRFYLQNGVLLFKPLSSNMDTPFHIAAIFGDIHLLRALLRVAAAYSPDDFKHISEKICEITNYKDNNILHEVAASGEVEVLKLLTKKIVVQDRPFLMPNQVQYLLKQKNLKGETPIFKAAAFAGQKMIRCMIGKIQPANFYDGHLHNHNHETILEIAILGQHFDSALWLLNKGYLDTIFTTKYDKDADIECLDMLANMPHAFKSGYKMGIWHRLIYKALPVYTYQWQYGIVLWLYYAFWFFIAKVIWPINDVWEKKKTHSEAMELLKLVLEKGKSWKDILSPSEGGQNRDKKNSEGKLAFDPLLLAASNGIVEMVTTILNSHPIAIDNTSSLGWNLVHVAVAYRRETIFRVLTEDWELPVKRLVTMIVPETQYTVMHQASDIELSKDLDQGIQFGPALQLQSELRWFEKVEDITPNSIQFDQESSHEWTARKLFTEQHKDLHTKAKVWLKETSTNCSTVAVLISGVAFAGACTVPGDYDDKGHPKLLPATLYTIFTISDVVALTSSLVSVVLFLSILTSPLPMGSFRHSLPHKLIWGFVTLFVSVVSTMLAFMAAVMLVIGMKQKYWTTSLAYSAVFLPVAIMGIVQFPLVYVLKMLIRPALAKALKITMFLVASFLIRVQETADDLFQKKQI